MKAVFQTIAKNLSNLILALALALAVWISAVSDSDPTEQRIFPRAVQIEFVGMDPSLVLLKNSASQVTITMSAPQSIWDQLTRDVSAVRALVDLSDIGPGEREVAVQIQTSISPVRVVTYSPASITIQLDSIVTRLFPVHMLVKGEPAIGYQADTAVLSDTAVTVSGPSTLMDRVNEIRASLDITGVSEPIDRSIALQAVDANGIAINDLTISPEQVGVQQNISQRGGYRNVVVKVITSGQVASGYRVTNISVFPPAVTVFSDDPVLVEQIPGYVETLPIDLNDVKDDLDLFLSLNLPPGVSLVGEQDVEVQVGIAAIEGSITLENMPVRITGLKTGLAAVISPETIDVILSGPLPKLDTLKTTDIFIIIDLKDLDEGVYQRIPTVEIVIEDIRVQSILPSSVEVRITLMPTPTITTTILPGQELQLKSTPTPKVSPTP